MSPAALVVSGFGINADEELVSQALAGEEAAFTALVRRYQRRLTAFLSQMVGDVELINPAIIHTLTEKGFIPVIAPVGYGKSGETYNINADLVAGAVAAALNAVKLILLTNVAGVLDGQGLLISSVNRHQAVSLMETGAASGGMIPKIKCCLEALEEGVAKAHILDGRVPHAMQVAGTRMPRQS